MLGSNRARLDVRSDEHGEEWRLLSILAGGCAVLGLSGWMISSVETAPPWLSVLFYIGAMVADPAFNGS